MNPAKNALAIISLWIKGRDKLRRTIFCPKDTKLKSLGENRKVRKCTTFLDLEMKV